MIHKRFLCICSLVLFILSALGAQDAGTGEEETDTVPIIEMEGIGISASSETSQAMKTVSRDEIERRNAPDLATLLQETLDIGLTRYGGYGNQTSITMRGFDSERIAFLIDGVPVNSPMTGDFDLSRLDLNTIERIDVIYGGSDTKYNVSGALGGVINIITVKEAPLGLRLGVSFANTSALPGEYRDAAGKIHSPQWADLLDTQNYALYSSFGAQRYSWRANVFANRAANHYFYEDPIFETRRRKEANEVWDTGATAALIWDLPDDSSKLIVSGNVYYGDKQIPTSGMSTIYGKQLDFSTGESVMLDMPALIPDELAMEASVSHAWHDLEYEAPSGALSEHTQQMSTVINRWTWYAGELLTLRMGWDYRLNRLDSNEIGKRRRNDGGLYLTAEYQAAESLLVIPSLKAVLSSPSEEQAVPVPKLGLLWTPLETLTIKNNYFRSFKLPDFEDMYWQGGGMSGSPDLKSEDGWGADLGAVWNYGGAKVDATFFTQRTTDSIHWAPGNGGVWSPQNVGKAHFFGFDSKVHLAVPPDSLGSGPLSGAGLTLSYQYLVSYLLSYGYDWGSNKRVPYSPEHTVGAAFDIAWGEAGEPHNGTLIVSAHYESVRFTNTSNITELEQYWLLNVNLNQQLGKDVAGFMAARNLLNTSYMTMENYPMQGFTLTLGVKLTLIGD
ncbi:TonB-dependent receptor plug domain-containing protein [Breznakiellaceae bacterium SP9]